MRLTYLLLSPTFGMHQYTADLANRMVGRHQVQLITTETYPADRYAPDVVAHTPVRLSNTGLSPESLNIAQLGLIKRSLQATRPDLVHITGPHLWNVALARWLRRAQIPIVHTLHDLDPHQGAGYGRLLHLWNRFIIHTADHIIVHGEIYRRRLLARGINAESVTCTPLTHLFLGFKAWQEVETSAVQVTYEPIVLFFGRLETYKGVDELLEAFQQLSNQNYQTPDGQRPRLILAGPGKLKRNWRAYAGGSVEWRNRLIGDEEGIDLFGRCAVVVLPYRDATQSAVIAAAYYFRKPVIVTSVGALPEYVEHGVTGAVVDNSDRGSGLAGTMKEMLLSGQNESLGASARAWYDEHRSRESQALHRLYEKLASQSLSTSHRPGLIPGKFKA